MNCDECKSLISAFMDCDLEDVTASDVRTHLALCEPCALVCEDFASILDVCGSEPSSELVPNAQAMWCRINNIIEGEIKPELAQLPPPPKQRGFFRFGLFQLGSAVLLIAVISSLLTVVAIRNFGPPSEADVSLRSDAPPTPFEKVLGRLGLVETPQQARERRLRQQHDAIEYWNARVMSKRQQWDRITREAFDRNLRVIDDSVNEYTMILQRDPEDDLSGEMLDSVLTEKMNLLRDFADL
jgi:hypothetical protein